MYKLKRIIFGLCVVSCMVHGAAAETKAAQDSKEYEVDVVAIKQRRLPCGLARLRERCCRKALPVIVNTTPNIIPIKYHDLDIDIPYRGGMGETLFAAQKVDYTYYLIGNEKFVVTPCPNYESNFKDNQVFQRVFIRYSQLKHTFSSMKTPKCPHGCPHSTCTTDYTCVGRNPKKITLNPGKDSNVTYHLNPGYIYRIMEKAKK